MKLVESMVARDALGDRREFTPKMNIIDSQRDGVRKQRIPWSLASRKTHKNRAGRGLLHFSLVSRRNREGGEGKR